MKIYIDILFLINFIIDYLLIGTAASLMSAQVKPWRHILSAGLGGIFGVCFFIPDLSLGTNFVTSLISGAITAFAAFYPCGVKELIKRLGVMYICSAFFAGAAFFDMSLFGGGIIKNGIFYVNTPRIIIAAAVVRLITALFSSMLKRRASQKLSGVILEYKGNRVHLTGLTDTGNGLYDPISGKPVMLIEPDILKKLINENCTAANLSEWTDSERLKLIPYQTIEGEGILNGLRLDRAVIDGRSVDGAIAAVSTNSLKYPVILHTGM